MASFTKPTIIAINGVAVSFALTITLPAVIRVAWKDAKVGIAFARRGLSTESCSTFYLPRLLGLSKAVHLATTGSAYSASDPLVTQLSSKLCHTPEETVTHAMDSAAEIAENTSLASTKLMRDMIVYCPPTPQGAHVLESRTFISIVRSPDNIEGVKSFMRETRPEFADGIEQADFPFWLWWDQSTDKPSKI